MYCVVKCIVCGNQACVKNADLCHLSCTVVMHRRKSASPVLNVLHNQQPCTYNEVLYLADGDVSNVTWFQAVMAQVPKY